MRGGKLLEITCRPGDPAFQDTEHASGFFVRDTCPMTAARKTLLGPTKAKGKEAQAETRYPRVATSASESRLGQRWANTYGRGAGAQVTQRKSLNASHSAQVTPHKSPRMLALQEV
ncbi:hypothetical protein PMIN06_004182 [Paraphaeosphaeria minitans]